MPHNGSRISLLAAGLDLAMMCGYVADGCCCCALADLSVEVVTRSHNEGEATLLAQGQLGKVFMGEHELALGRAGHVMARMGRTDGAAV